MDKYLASTYYIDFDSPVVRDFAEAALSAGMNQREQAIALYYAVRDSIRYNPYRSSTNKDEYRASWIIQEGEGFCVQKSIVLAAVLRRTGIPARLGYANVRNHLTSKRLLEFMKTDLFVFHGYNEIYLEGKWVKATPAFNRELCEKTGVIPLEFDGYHDSIFHPFDTSGKKHMEYVHDYGTFDDFPFDMMIQECLKYYPHLSEYYFSGRQRLDGDLAEEILSDKQKK